VHRKIKTWGKSVARAGKNILGGGTTEKRQTTEKVDYRPPPLYMALSRVPGDDELYVGG
jgi:hypothetical protein